MPAPVLNNLGNDVVLIKPGTVITATGTSAPVRLDNKGVARLSIDVTAASGTSPSLTATVQTSADSGVNDPWRTVAAFAAATAVSTERKSFAGLDRFVRVSYAVSGTTPSLTLGITGEAV